MGPLALVYGLVSVCLSVYSVFYLDLFFSFVLCVCVCGAL